MLNLFIIVISLISFRLKCLQLLFCFFVLVIVCHFFLSVLSLFGNVRTLVRNGSIVDYDCVAVVSRQL